MVAQCNILYYIMSTSFMFLAIMSVIYAVLMLSMYSILHQHNLVYVILSQHIYITYSSSGMPIFILPSIYLVFISPSETPTSSQSEKYTIFFLSKPLLVQS